ncbi:MAG: cobalamin-binding protein [Pirellulales bacterium]
MPQRIVSLLSSATEMLYGLGLGERVVAVSHECDWPADAATKPRATFSRINSTLSSGQIDEEVRRMLAAGEALYGVDENLLAELRPGLIVTQAQCDVCAVRYADVLDVVERTPALAGARVVALNPMSLDDVLADIRRVAEAAGVDDGGAAFVGRLSGRVGAVRERTGRLVERDRPRTALVEWTEPLMLAGNWMPELLELAGGTCPLATAGQHSGYVDWSRIVEFDPQAIVVAPCGFDLERSLLEARTLPALPQWSRLSAVRSGRVYVVDGNAYFNRSGPRLVDSLEMLAHLLHPRLVARPAWLVGEAPPWQAL